MKNRVSLPSRPNHQRRPARPRVSLQRALSKLGFCSRSEALSIIEGGKVTVDGKQVTDPAHRVDIAVQRINVKGLQKTIDRPRTMAFHKPRGVVTTRKDERGRRTVFDILGPSGDGVKAIGRLDLDSSGLLLLTTDHRLLDKLTSPESSVDKEYEVDVDKDVDRDSLNQLRSGISIVVDGRSYTTRPAIVELTGLRKLRMTLTEGKNRQIRKMAEAAGLHVLRLHRVRVGSIRLGDLAEGTWRTITTAELAMLSRSWKPNS